VTVLTYRLGAGDAELVVDLAVGSAGWTEGGEPIPTRQLIGLAPRADVERIVRRAIADVRAQAAATGAPSGATLRDLAGRIWRDYRDALGVAADQVRLPGL
jgi:hypothetical protein